MFIKWYFSEILDYILVIEVEGIGMVVEHIKGYEIRMCEDESVVDYQ